MTIAIPGRLRRVAVPAAVAAVYAVGVWVVFLPLGLVDATHLAATAPASCGCGDNGQQMWLLAVAHADLVAGRLPFFTHAVNYPIGVNLLDSASFPLLATLAAPLTGAVGPAGSLALLLRVGMLTSALSMYAALRRLGRSDVAAALGGAVYGFSPYMMRQAGSHVFLEVAPLPPIILAVVYHQIRARGGRPVRAGLLAGVLLAVQGLVDVEVAASIVLVAVVVGAALAVGRAWRRRPVRAALVRAARLSAGASVVVVPILAYPMWYLLGGPDHIDGTPSPPGAYPVGLLATLLPTGRGVVAGLWSGWRLAPVGFLSDLSFVGIPLVVVAVWIVARRRRDPLVVAAAVLGALSWLLAIGPRLQLGAWRIPLPFAVLTHLPVLQSLITNRFTLYVYLALAVVVAVGTDSLIGRARAGRWPSAAAGGAVLAAGVALMLPSATIPVVGAAHAGLFASARGRRLLPAGAVVIAYPYPRYTVEEAMLWQAASGVRFRLVGGYAEHAAGAVDVDGAPIVLPAGVSRSDPTKAAQPIEPAAVSDLFLQPEQVSAAAVAEAEADLPGFVARSGVTAAVVDTDVAGGTVVSGALTSVFGPPVHAGPMRIWSRLRSVPR